MCNSMHIMSSGKGQGTSHGARGMRLCPLLGLVPLLDDLGYRSHFSET